MLTRVELAAVMDDAKGVVKAVVTKYDAVT